MHPTDAGAWKPLPQLSSALMSVRLCQPSGAAVAQLASAGLCGKSPTADLDQLEPYVKVLLDLLGLTDVDRARADGGKLEHGAERREQAVERAASLAA